MNKGIIRVISVLLFFTFILAGCGGGGSAPAGNTGAATTAAPAGSGKDSIVVEISSDPPSLHGGFASNIVSAFCSDQIFDKLVTANPDGSFSPSLAKSWEFTEDGKDIIFEIRDDITFHNGDKMTLEDVVFSYNEIINGTYADTATSAMVKAEAVDDSHVKVEFTSVYGPAMTCIATSYMGIFPKAVYEADPDAFIRKPVGTGPYKFVSWTSGDSIVLVRNDDYFAGTPPIKNLTLRVFIDASVAAIALENGEIDVLTNPMQTDRKTLQNNANIKYEETESAMTTWGFFNLGEESPFHDQKLRDAFSYAIDREAVMLGAMEGAAVPANSSFPSFIPLGNPDYKPKQFDLEKAQSLMQELGYGPDNHMQLTIAARETPHYYRPLEVIQSQLAEIYVDAVLEKTEAGAWGENILRKSDFEFNLLATTMGFYDMDERYELYHSKGGQNFYHMNSPALDAALDLNRNSSDEETRRQAHHDVIRVLDEETLIIPIYGNMRGIAYNKDLKGIAPNPGYRYQIKDWSW